MDNKFIKVGTKNLQDIMKYNDVVLLVYKIKYPYFESAIYRKAAERMNIFYEKDALSYERYLRKELFDMAVEQYKYDIENNYPVKAFEAVTEFYVTYNDCCIVSLYTDKYEYTAGAHGNTLRTSQTWNMQKKRTIELKDLFKYQQNYKEYIFKNIKKQIESDESIYFPDWEKLIIDTFNEKNFYATDEGVVIYYQQYDIAPYSSSIREFLIPYGIYVINPKYLCK